MEELDNKLRYRLSKFYIDIAAKLPKFQTGKIAILQELRTHQHKEAEEYLAKSKRPEGNDLALNSIYIYELYFLEDFKKLEQNLFNIYAKQEKKFSLTDNISRCKEFINRAYENFSFGSWANLCRISSESKKGKYISSFVSTYFKDFPREFDYIQLGLHHILPSVIVVSFNIKIKEDINKEIETIINSKWLGKITFFSLLPWKLPWKFGYSCLGPRQEKEKVLYDYFQKLRGKAENFISKYFKGYFLSNRKDSTNPVCPSIEVFSISKISQGQKNIEKKPEPSSEFWYSLGFKWSFATEIFKTDNLLFFDIPPESFSPNYTYRLLVEKKGLDTKWYGGSIKGAIEEKASSFSLGYTNSIILLELCKKTMKQVLKLRSIIGKSIFSKRFSPRRFTRLLNLSENIDREIFILNRLFSEYEYIKSNPKMWKYEQLDMINIEKLNLKLPDCLLNSIDHYINLIKKQYDVTNDTFKNCLSGLSSKISYSLQERILWLTLFLVIGLLFQLIPQETRFKIWVKLIEIVGNKFQF